MPIDVPGLTADLTTEFSDLSTGKTAADAAAGIAQAIDDNHTDGGSTTAEALGTSGADVNVGSAAPPTAGQVLTATSATAATWQTPAASAPATQLDANGTTLDVDAIDDDEYLKRVGTSIVSRSEAEVLSDIGGASAADLASEAATRAADDATEAAARAAADTALAAPQYLVLANTGTLANERAWTLGNGLDAVDGGAGSTYTVTVDETELDLAAMGGTLDAQSGGTGITGYAVGDLLYADTTTTLAKLAAVATGKVLVSQGVGTAPAWAPLAGAHFGTILTTKGDLLGRDESTAARVPVGAANGSVLTADSNQSLGVAYRMPAGDMVVYGGGADGALVFDGVAAVTIDGVAHAPSGGVYTLTREPDATTITGSDTVRIETRGFMVRCHKLVGPASGTFTIADSGNPGVGTTAGAALVTTTGTLMRGSGAGGAGRTGAAAAGGNGGTMANSRGGNGGAGGNAGGGTPLGGTAGAVTGTDTQDTRRTAGVMLISGRPFNGNSANVGRINGGGGGGGGGHEGISGLSGAGGSGGGYACVRAREIVNGAQIVVSANGGAGAAATGTDSGGGGGGGGGYATLVYTIADVVPSVTATGGSGGAGNGGGANGANGSDGTTDIVTPP